MIKRYIRFAVKGFYEGVNGGKHSAMEIGICDARLDPVQVAMKRNGQLAGCSRITVKCSPAFSVAVEGDRSKTKGNILATKLMREALGHDVPEGVTKTKKVRLGLTNADHCLQWASVASPRLCAGGRPPKVFWGEGCRARNSRNRSNDSRNRRGKK